MSFLSTCEGYITSHVTPLVNQICLI